MLGSTDFAVFEEISTWTETIVYGIFDSNETVVLGGSGLHTRIGPGALEIGYWVQADHIGKGYATEVCAALTRSRGHPKLPCRPAQGPTSYPEESGLTRDPERDEEITIAIFVQNSSRPVGESMSHNVRHR